MLPLLLVSQKVYPVVQVTGIYVGSGIKPIPTSRFGSNGKCNVNTEWWGWKGPLEITPSNPLLEQAPPEQGHRTASRRGVNVSREGTPQPLWAACAPALAPAQGRGLASCSGGTSCVPACARGPLAWRWAPLKRVQSLPPDTRPLDIYKH